MGNTVEKEAQREVLISWRRYNKVSGSTSDDVEVPCVSGQSHSVLLHHVRCVDLGDKSFIAR